MLEGADDFSPLASLNYKCTMYKCTNVLCTKPLLLAGGGGGVVPADHEWPQKKSSLKLRVTASDELIDHFHNKDHLKTNMTKVG
jgi:hypothetical protein